MQTPAARREVLIAVAGIAWLIAGIILIIMAYKWAFSGESAHLIFLAIGMAIGITIYYFGFSKLARINLARIYNQSPGKDKICIFAFQNIRGYIILIVMMTLGFILRHSPIPKIYLVPIYAAIGLALALSSAHYFRALR